MNDEEAMMASMGILGFGTTKSSKNNTGLARSSGFGVKKNSTIGQTSSSVRDTSINTSFKSNTDKNTNNEEGLSKKQKITSDVNSSVVSLGGLSATTKGSVVSAVSSLSMYGSDSDSDSDDDVGPQPLRQIPTINPTNSKSNSGDVNVSSCNTNMITSPNNTINTTVKHTNNMSINQNDSDSDDEYTVPIPLNTNTNTNPNTNTKINTHTSNTKVDADWDDSNDYSSDSEEEGGRSDVRKNRYITLASTDLSHLNSTAKLLSHTRAVTALTVSSRGDILYSCGFDGLLSVFNFESVRDMRATRADTIREGGGLTGMAYSTQHGEFLLSSSNPSILSVNEDLQVLGEAMKGYPYIVDVTKNKGHKGGVKQVVWSPLDAAEFMTCSDDGAAMLWRRESFEKQCRAVVKPPFNMQRRVANMMGVAHGNSNAVTACVYSEEGHVVLACEDGMLHVFHRNKVTLPSVPVSKTGSVSLPPPLAVTIPSTSLSLGISVGTMLFVNKHTLAVRGCDGDDVLVFVKIVGDCSQAEVVEVVLDVPNEVGGVSVGGGLSLNGDGRVLAVTVGVKELVEVEKDEEEEADVDADTMVVKAEEGDHQGDQGDGDGEGDGDGDGPSSSFPSVIKEEGVVDDSSLDTSVKSETKSEIKSDVKSESDTFVPPAVNRVFPVEAPIKHRLEPVVNTRVKGSGAVLFFDTRSLALIHQIAVSAPATTIAWSAVSGDIFVGLSNGNIECLYNTPENASSPVVGVRKCVGRRLVVKPDLSHLMISRGDGNVFNDGLQGKFTLHGVKRRAPRGTVVSDQVRKAEGNAGGVVNQTTAMHHMMVNKVLGLKKQNK